MVNISIDVTDLGGEARPGDKVVLWKPAAAGSATHAGRVISTAPVDVFLTSGKATVPDVEPGSMRVLLQCRGVESQGPIDVTVPDGTGTVTLRSLVEAQFEYAPPIVSAVQQAADNAAASERAAIQAQVRSENAADRTEARVDDAINNGANLIRAEVKQDADRAVSARQAATQSESNAKASEGKAATSESNAAASETNAKQSETNAGDYAAVATTAATEAVDAMAVASESAASIGDSVSSASISAANAAQSEANAATHERQALEAADRIGTAEQVGDWAQQANDSALTAIDARDDAVAAANRAEESVSDSAVSSAIIEGSATGAAVDARARAVARSEKLMVNIDPADFGATPLNDSSGEGADSTDALLAALDHVRSIRDPQGRDVSRRITINAWYKFNRDIIIDDIDGLEIVGEGGNSGLLGINAGITIGSTTRLLSRPTLRNMRVRRVTTSGNEHGIALRIAGGGMNKGGYPARWALDHVEVESPIHPNGLNPEQSIALKLEGTFLATCTSVYLRSAHTGLVIDVDSVDGNLAANAITFTGGEIQAVRHIGRIDKAIGIAFFGMAWEGATEGGMDVNDTQGLTVQGVYWERNSGYDLRLGETAMVRGVTIHGGISSPGAISALPEKATKRSVIVRRARGLSISGIHFVSYEIPPVIVDQASTNTVHGGLSHCSHSRLGTPVEEVVSATSWNDQAVRSMSVGYPGELKTAMQITGDAGTQRGIEVRSGDSLRWFAGGNATSETGENAGSQFQVTAYSDSGSYLGEIMTLYRSTLQTRIRSDIRIDGDIDHNGEAVGFFGVVPTSRPEVAGSRSDGTAFESLLAALVKLGLVTDQTTT